MTPTVFALSLVALLVSPGPTNTLIALGGAARGFSRALPLIGAELSGYLLVITPLALFGRPLLEAHPALSGAVRIAAAVWVMALAVRLWARPGAGGDAGLVTFRRVFVTTLLNPKGLVIGLALLPATTPLGLLPWLALFSALVLVVAGGWIAAGAAVGRATAGRVPPLLRRGAAGYLGLVAVGLATSVL
jgi:threonine/homoserine/homoserine lactone efflux protein